MCVVRAVTSNAQPAFAWHANDRHCGGYLSEGGKTREPAARARRAALVVIGLRTLEGRCTCPRPLSLAGRPWCDVRAMTSNTQPVFVWHANKRHCGGCLSGGDDTRELAVRARCATLAAIGVRAMGGNTTSVEGLSPSVQHRGTTCELWPPAHSRLLRGTRTRVCHCAGCLSEGNKMRKLAPRARRAALAAIGQRTMEGYCTGERPLSFSPSVQVRDATCEL